MKRKVTVAVVLLALVGAIAALLWPAREDTVAYPFADLVPEGARSPLWTMDAAAFERLVADDTERLLRFGAALDAGVRSAEEASALLGAERADDLTAAQRDRVRHIWYGVLEPLVALESLKHRYGTWFGIDFRRHPTRHAAAYALAYGSFLAQMAGGLRFVALTQGHDAIETLLDERIPELGLGPRTFAGLKYKVLHVRRYAEVVSGFDWYRLFLAKHVRAHRPALHRFVRDRHARAFRRIAKRGAIDLAKNAADIVRDHAFEQWLPVQKAAAEWMGDTRLVPEERRLVNDRLLEEVLALLRPGDLLVERRNWYLSNVGLPGFWPHAALYFGTPGEIASYLGEDPEVRAEVGPIPETWARRYPRAWAALLAPDVHPRRVIEAVSEGVVFQSFEHSCGADYVAALRPRLPKVAVARALERALRYHGRPYDFDFDFASDASLVCSELVQKAYDAPGGGPGLSLPFVTIAGRRTVPPTEIVRLFARERGREDAQLEFVFFLDGLEEIHRAVESTADELAASCERPKWDLAQP